MRRRMQARLWKAARQAGHRNPGWANIVAQIERARPPLDRVLSKIVSDCSCELKLRNVAARLLRNVGGYTSAFVPLLTEFIAAGDVKNSELCSVIQSMNHGWGRLTRPEFEILLSTLRGGTSEQRYWVVNEIAFFTNPYDHSKVRHALIEVLDDRAAPPEVRGWAAERLHMHISRKTVHACIRAVEDPSPEVRLWAVYTLGSAGAPFGAPHPLYREVVTPVLERVLADDAVVPGWWRVRREAQTHLPDLHGSSVEAARLQAEIQTILNDPAASAEDKHWAGFNSTTDFP